MGNALEGTVGRVNTLMGEFRQEADDSLRPNKAAAKRARKLSLEIEKQLKEYRKQSVKL